MKAELLNLVPVIPEMFVLAMALIALMVDVFIGKGRHIITFFVVLAALVGAFILTAALYHYPQTFAFNDMFIHDKVASLMKLLVYITSFFAFIYARVYIKERKMEEGEYYVLGLLSVLGMMVLVSANSLLVLFLGLEILSLPLYAMVALRRNVATASEAAMKYYIMGAMATGIMLYGMSMLYGVTSNLNIMVIADQIGQATGAEQIVILLSVVFIIAGLAFKLGAAPFHMWAPDVYDGAPTPVTLFIGSAPKIAALGMVIRLLVDTMPAYELEWSHILIVVALLSMALGNVVAIVQTNIKRMLAYSSIAHMGYMFLGVLAGSSSGYAAAIFYMFIYAIMSMGAFAVVVLLSRAGVEVENIADIRGLNSRNPWLALMMLLVMFSMAGIPPTVGFFAKLGVLEALISAHLVWLAAIALIFAVIGAYYYLAVVKAMYFEEPQNATPITGAWDMKLAISINSIAVVALGIYPTALIDLCRNAIGVG